MTKKILKMTIAAQAPPLRDCLYWSVTVPWQVEDSTIPCTACLNPRSNDGYLPKSSVTTRTQQVDRVLCRPFSKCGRKWCRQDGTYRLDVKKRAEPSGSSKGTWTSRSRRTDSSLWPFQILGHTDSITHSIWALGFQSLDVQQCCFLIRRAVTTV